MLFDVPASKLNPAGFRTLREADNISPAQAMKLQRVLKNLTLGGAMFVGNDRMPIDEYITLGGPANEPVYIRFENDASARLLADAFNQGLLPGLTEAFWTFTEVKPGAVVPYLMELFPAAKQAFLDAMVAVASKGV